MKLAGCRSRRHSRQRGGGVVHHLRQQSADVDAVRGRELQPACKRRDPRTTALTSRWQSSNVPLTRNVRTLRPQQVSCCAWRGDTRPAGYRITTSTHGRPIERRSHRAAGIARRRHQDRDAPRVVARQTFQRRREEACAEVLERGRRAVKQLEHAQRSGRVRHVDERRRERERIVEHGAQLRVQRIAREEWREQHAPDRRAASRGDGPRVERNRRQSLRHVESAIRRQPMPDRVLRSTTCAAVARADEAHQSPTMRAPAGSMIDTQESVSSPCRRNAATIDARTAVRRRLLGPREHGGTRTRNRAAERARRDRGALDVGESRNQPLALRLDDDVEQRLAQSAADRTCSTPRGTRRGWPAAR